jgi:transcriptional regulator NrdR family protein
MVMIPMQCPRCSSSEIRAVTTNGKEAEITTRKRRCVDCGHSWFTVELPVHVAVIGWSRETGKSLPVLRVPIELAVGEGAV